MEPKNITIQSQEKNNIELVEYDNNKSENVIIQT